MPREDSYPTARMRRLIGIFAPNACFLALRLLYLLYQTVLQHECYGQTVFMVLNTITGYNIESHFSFTTVSRISDVMTVFSSVSIRRLAPGYCCLWSGPSISKLLQQIAIESSTYQFCNCIYLTVVFVTDEIECPTCT